MVWTLLGFYTRDITPERMFATLFGLLNKNSYPGLGWTVLIEFQFYLIFPFLLLFSRQYGTRYLVGLLGTMVMLRWLFWNQLGSVQYISYWTILGRIDQFLCGMIGYVIYRRYHRWLGSPLFLIAVITTWLLIFHWINQNGGYYGQPESKYFQSMWIVVPTLEGLFYMLITVSYLRLRIRLFRWMDLLLAWLGTLSYSLYLNHETVVGVCFNWAIKYKWPVGTPLQVSLYALLAAFPLLVAVSAATYYLIEKPFLGLRRSYLIEATSPAPESSSVTGDGAR
jgi:peptidoglycan/LPS O-acetylase OafA/YrhL